jgi:hypothetical protein
LIKQTQLWDTTGVVPIISANTIMAHKKIETVEQNKLTIKKEEK